MNKIDREKIELETRHEYIKLVQERLKSIYSIDFEYKDCFMCYKGMAYSFEFFYNGLNFSCLYCEEIKKNEVFAITLLSSLEKKENKINVGTINLDVEVTANTNVNNEKVIEDVHFTFDDCKNIIFIIDYFYKNADKVIGKSLVHELKKKFESIQCSIEQK